MAEGGGLLNADQHFGHHRFSSQILHSFPLQRSIELAGVGSQHAVLARRRDNRGDSFRGELAALSPGPATDQRSGVRRDAVTAKGTALTARSGARPPSLGIDSPRSHKHEGLTFGPAAANRPARPCELSNSVWIQTCNLGKVWAVDDASRCEIYTPRLAVVRLTAALESAQTDV